MNLALQELVKKRDQLIAEQLKMNNRFDNEIGEIEKAIETLSGKTVFEVWDSYHFDDESLDYIKASQEEI